MVRGLSLISGDDLSFYSRYRKNLIKITSYLNIPKISWTVPVDSKLYSSSLKEHIKRWFKTVFN